MKTMKGIKHFKNVSSYHRWLAYGHIHGDFQVPGVQKVFIRRREHKVVHKR